MNDTFSSIPHTYSKIKIILLSLLVVAVVVGVTIYMMLRPYKANAPDQAVNNTLPVMTRDQIFSGIKASTTMSTAAREKVSESTAAKKVMTTEQRNKIINSL